MPLFCATVTAPRAGKLREIPLWVWPDLAGELGEIVGHDVSHRAVGVN